MRTKYFTHPNGIGVCLWRISKRGIRVFGRVDKRWGASASRAEHFIHSKSKSFIQVTRDEARKWYPKAFTEPFTKPRSVVRVQYFTHTNNKALYRFPVNNKDLGECFGLDKVWTGGEVRRIIPSNWTQITTAEARKRFPLAFREVKA